MHYLYNFLKNWCTRMYQFDATIYGNNGDFFRMKHYYVAPHDITWLKHSLFGRIANFITLLSCCHFESKKYEIK